MTQLTSYRPKYVLGYELGLVYLAVIMAATQLFFWTRLGYPIYWVPEYSVSGAIEIGVFVLLMPISYAVGMLVGIVTYHAVKGLWGVIT